MVSVVSCKKAESPVTREDELRDGKWKMVTGTIRADPYSGLDTTYNYFATLPDCEKDDYLVFKTNFDGTQNSASKCSPAEPDEIQFRWELYNNATGINFWNAEQTFFGRSTLSAPIINYTSSRFTLRYVELTVSPVDNTKRDTFTYTHTFEKF
jgi:hypothetical protein